MKKKKDWLNEYLIQDAQRREILSLILTIFFHTDSDFLLRQKCLKLLKSLPDGILPRNFLQLFLNQTFENALSDRDALIEIFFEKLQNLPEEEIPTLTSLITKAMNTEFPPLMAWRILQEKLNLLVIRWKKEKKETIAHLIKEAQDFDTIQAFFKELQEIENFSIYDIESSEEKTLEYLLQKACKKEHFDISFEYLYEDFIPKGSISLWVAPASQGKSALALTLALKLLEEKKVEKVFYFDGDNPISVLNQRGLHKLVEKYQGKFFYFMPENAKEFQELVSKIYGLSGKFLIVIDTLRAYIGPQDINKGEVAEKAMEVFRSLVRNGEKTVILLHHVNKIPPAAYNTEISLGDRIKGATEFRDRCDIAYFIQKKKQENGEIWITLKNIKPRIPVKDTIHFKVNLLSHSVEELPEILSKEEETFINAVLEVIYTYSRTTMRYPNKSVLENNLREKGFGRNQIRAWLEKFNGKYWRQSYDGLYNQIVYKPIEENWQSRQTGELKNNGHFGRFLQNQPNSHSRNKENGQNCPLNSERYQKEKWQTRRSGELRNNQAYETTSHNHTLNTETKKENWQSRQTGELKNNQHFSQKTNKPKEEIQTYTQTIEEKFHKKEIRTNSKFATCEKQTGELRNNQTQNMVEYENRNYSQTRINSEFASSPSLPLIYHKPIDLPDIDSLTPEQKEAIEKYWASP